MGKPTPRATRVLMCACFGAIAFSRPASVCATDRTWLAANSRFFSDMNAWSGSVIPGAADNALIGTASDVAAQIKERFHPDDRLMLWFDFFNHDNARVIANMEDFMAKVAPLVNRPAA